MLSPAQVLGDASAIGYGAAAGDLRVLVGRPILGGHSVLCPYENKTERTGFRSAGVSPALLTFPIRRQTAGCRRVRCSNQIRWVHSPAKTLETQRPRMLCPYENKTECARDVNRSLPKQRSDAGAESDQPAKPARGRSRRSALAYVEQFRRHAHGFAEQIRVDAVSLAERVEPGLLLFVRLIRERDLILLRRARVGLRLLAAELRGQVAVARPCRLWRLHDSLRFRATRHTPCSPRPNFVA